MELFDLLNSMFGSSKKYLEATTIDKRKNYFMVQRRLAIGYPLQASFLNHIRINQEQAVDIWYRFTSKKHEKTPHWLYLSGVKKVQEKKEKAINIKQETAEEYCRANSIDLKSFWDAVKMFPEDIQKDLKEWERMTK